MEQHLKYISEEIESMKKWCEELDGLTYGEMEDKLWDRYMKLKDYVEENKVPIKFYLDDIIDDNYSEDEYDESSYYGEFEESSYYDEDEEFEESNY